MPWVLNTQQYTFLHNFVLCVQWHWSSWQPGSMQHPHLPKDKQANAMLSLIWFLCSTTYSELSHNISVICCWCLQNDIWNIQIPDERYGGRLSYWICVCICVTDESLQHHLLQTNCPLPWQQSLEGRICHPCMLLLHLEQLCEPVLSHTLRSIASGTVQIVLPLILSICHNAKVSKISYHMRTNICSIAPCLRIFAILFSWSLCMCEALSPNPNLVCGNILREHFALTLCLYTGWWA